MEENIKSDLLGRLTGEKTLYDLTLPMIEKSFQQFIESYTNKDRGLTNAFFLTYYLFKNDGYIAHLKELTEFLEEDIPGMKGESEIMEKLMENVASPLLETCEEGVKRELFYPEEFSKVAVGLGTLILYFVYRGGINLIRIADLKGNLKDLVKKYKPIVRTFIQPTPLKNIKPYKYGSKEWRYLVFFTIDAHNTFNFLLENMKSKNRGFTLSYAPLQGLEEILLSKINQQEEEVKRRIRYRNIESISLLELLSIACNHRKIEKHYERIYQQNKIPAFYL